VVLQLYFNIDIGRDDVMKKKESKLLLDCVGMGTGFDVGGEQNKGADD